MDGFPHPLPAYERCLIIIIIIILIHYHKGLSAVGLSLPTDSLGLQSLFSPALCVLIGGYSTVQSHLEEYQTRSRRERGWNRGDIYVWNVFRVCLWSRCVKAVGREDMIVYSSRVRGVIAAEK